MKIKPLPKSFKKRSRKEAINTAYEISKLYVGMKPKKLSLKHKKI